MIITHILRYLKVDISSESAYPPSINIDYTLLKRMQPGTRAQAQPLPTELSSQFASRSSSSFADRYAILMNQMTALSLSHSEDATKILAN